MYFNIAHNGFDLKGAVYTTSWVDRNSDFWRKKTKLWSYCTV